MKRKVDKLIVTNRTSLRRKYGRGTAAVNAAIKRWIAADKKRGIHSLRVDLDEVEKGLKNTEIASTTLQRLTKAAIDKAFGRHKPHYLVILGATDVVPMQELTNPMNSDNDPENDDEDPVVPSDLPYACEEEYSPDPATFLGPVRVLGRLPDMVGARKPDYLVGLLDKVTRWKCRPRSDYRSYFAVSTVTWKDSTELSMEKLFHDPSSMKISPPSGPDWSATALKPRFHFINCHGADSTPKFFGEDDEENFPTAHFSRKLKDKVTEGTVVAAECCYGAMLYDPAHPADKRDTGLPGIAVTYLDEGAYGFFGASTIAYGPSEGNGQADYICQYFIEGVQDGASLGRAALDARHRFASKLSHLDPADLKTLAQFYLLGDPSIIPVESPKHALSRSRTYKRVFGPGRATPGSRDYRRERAARAGRNLARTLGAVKPSRASVPVTVRLVLAAIARESKLTTSSIQAYRVIKNSGRTEVEVADRRIYTLTGSIGGRLSEGGKVVSIIATTEKGQIVHLRRVHSR